MPTVNERFRDIRKELGFNQQQFAYELGISQTHISGIENGRDNPSKSLLKFLCAKFSVSEEWMLEGTGTPLPEWDITTDKGAIAKYNALRVSFEKCSLLPLEMILPAWYKHFVTLSALWVLKS